MNYEATIFEATNLNSWYEATNNLIKKTHSVNLSTTDFQMVPAGQETLVNNLGGSQAITS